MNDHSNMPEARNSVSQPDLSALNTTSTPHDQAIREAKERFLANCVHCGGNFGELLESILRDLVAKVGGERTHDAGEGVPLGVYRAMEKKLTELRVQLTAAQNESVETKKQLENFTASTIHSCGDHCQRPMCVLRRQLVACEKVRLEYQARLEKANLL